MTDEITALTQRRYSEHAAPTGVGLNGVERRQPCGTRFASCGGGADADVNGDDRHEGGGGNDEIICGKKFTSRIRWMRIFCYCGAGP
jgi:hypothetical protein